MDQTTTSTATIREPSYQALKDIIANGQAVRFRYGSNKRSILVDTFTASAIVAVYDACRDSIQQAKIERMVAGSDSQFQRVASFCMERVGTSSSARTGARA